MPEYALTVDYGDVRGDKNTVAVWEEDEKGMKLISVEEIENFNINKYKPFYLLGEDNDEDNKRFKKEFFI